MARQLASDRASRYADMFAAMGAEPRLRIMQLLLTAHPQGMVAGDIQTGLGIPPSTLSHHLDKLKHEGLVRVRRERTFLWYTANIDALQELLAFLYAECCTRSRAAEPSVWPRLAGGNPNHETGKSHEHARPEKSSPGKIRASCEAGPHGTEILLRTWQCRPHHNQSV